MADATHADSAHIKPVAPAAEDSPVPLAAAVSSADAFRRFWPWARPDRYRLAASAVLLIAGSAGEVASVWLFKNLVDQVLIPHRFTAFLPLAGLMAAVAVVAAHHGIRFDHSQEASDLPQRARLRGRRRASAPEPSRPGPVEGT
ncbi:hypothetical protein [Streptomyces sp. NBC_00353]|uniref:hypothetical protein n=1 Tax=unclassified Streptomyces TaxID=2593676 RepID=UPI002E26FB67